MSWELSDAEIETILEEGKKALASGGKDSRIKIIKALEIVQYTKKVLENQLKKFQEEREILLAFIMENAAIKLIHLIIVDRPFRFSRSLPVPNLDKVNIKLNPIPRDTLSLPAYIVVPPSELGDNESLGGSTESTLSAEENRERIDVEVAGSSLKADVKPLDAEELEEATETVVKVVDETLQKVGGAEAAGAGLAEGLASRLAEGARRAVLQGMRHRRQQPKEPQRNVLSSEDEKND